MRTVLELGVGGADVLEDGVHVRALGFRGEADDLRASIEGASS